MSFSNAKAAALLNEIYRDEPVYLALYTTNPTANDTGQEVTGGGYARVEIPFSAPAVEGGKQTIKNNIEIQFSPAETDWGTITHVALRTAATEGELISFAPLQNARTILTGDRFVVLVENGVLRLS